MSSIDVNVIVQEMLVEQRERVHRGESAGSIPADKLEDQVLDETTVTPSMTKKKKRVRGLQEEDRSSDSGVIEQEEDDYDDYDDYENIVEQREFTQEERDRMAKNGHAMKDGSFPIENAAHLSDAIKAHGRAKDPAAAKAHIKKRAKALGRTDMLPDSWSQENDSVTQSDGERFLNWLKGVFFTTESVVEQDLGIPGNAESPVQPEVGVTNPQQTTKPRKRKKPVAPKEIGDEDQEDLFEAKAHNKVRVTQEAPILQMDEMKHIVTGVVQTPDVEVRPASMPNTILIYPRSTVEQMAHDFMKSYHNGQIGIRHTEVQQGQIVSLNGEHATVVESYIAPIDMVFPDGRTVIQGSWVMSVQIANEQAWQDVLSGELKAFSLSSTDVDFTTLGD